MISSAQRVTICANSWLRNQQRNGASADARPLYLKKMEEFMSFMDKHAPRSVDDLVIENKHTKQRLEDYASGDRSRHMIMHGPKGTGKSSAARVIAEARTMVDGEQVPFWTRNAASMTAADFGAILNEWDFQRQCGVRHPVTIIEEVDKLSAGMRDQLQAFIDEFGKHGQIIATSNNLDGLSYAQQDRFDQIKMPPVSAAACEERVRHIFASEGAQVSDDHMRRMLGTTHGSWRDIGSAIEDMVLDSTRQKKA